jgi:5'-methylthioinosine phosphorylase
MNKLAVIGGTGLDQLQGLEIVATHSPDTPYGAISRQIEEGRLGQSSLFFMQRHGSPRAIPPHLINYRANLWALDSLGVTDVIAINSVGGITAVMQTGCLVFPDQLIDYTWGREHSFDDGSSGSLMHIDFTQPYDRGLRQALLEVANARQIPHQPTAVHGVMQGPRLETAAEIQRLAGDGCDLVGMTGMPEASLARELGMAYAAVCMVVNPAAGVGELPISLDTMHEILRREAAVVVELLEHFARAYYSSN